MFGDLFRAASNIVGSAAGIVCGVAIAPIAIALDCTEAAVKAAVRAGCRTQREIRDWVDENWDN